jgi:hypothetical protein
LIVALSVLDLRQMVRQPHWSYKGTVVFRIVSRMRGNWPTSCTDDLAHLPSSGSTAQDLGVRRYIPSCYVQEGPYMPKPIHKLPTYRPDKSSGQAEVTVGGKDIDRGLHAPV